ncbi:flagellar hook-length control protein FliK [Rugamonas sp. A1-17]|nr:flagellar hook-length control protein FliK [Rugamonas sp. A1-17]
MSMTLSNATAAAKAAKAELTAPVAANHGGLDSMPTRQASHDGGATVTRVPPKSPPLTGNGKATQASAKPAPHSAVPSSQNDPVSQPGRDAAAPAADETQDRAPLFAQLLQLTDPLALDTGAAPAPAAADSPASTDDTADAGATAATDALVPAMVGALLTSATPAPVPAAASGTPAPVRTEAIGATSTLNNAATRLNLSAASVAVTAAPLPLTPAPAAGDTPAAAAAPAPAPVNTSVVTPQNIYAMANSAALGAQAQQSQSDTPATAAPAPAASAASPAPADAPLLSAAFTPALPRVAPRGADAAGAAGDSTDYNASATTAAVTAAAAKDDSIGRASAPAPAPVGNSVGFSQAPQTAAPAPAAVVKLAGAPDQWQQPLREALGDRLQVQLQRNNDHAVIRLEPPNMGSIEISIRHSAGSLQVNLSANHSEVLRQLNTIGDSVRQDLSTRQYADVSVTVSSSRAQAQADSGGRNGQQREQDEGRTPGRALSDDDTTTFAMTSERE